VRGVYSRVLAGGSDGSRGTCVHHELNLELCPLE